MPKYQSFYYGDGTLYGQTSRVAFSAEPITATALSHSKIQVTWTKPTNTNSAAYVGFRIVRNQDAFPETEEDGVILYEFFTKTAEIVPVSSYLDGEDPVAGIAAAPLVSGRFAYYRAWILLDEAGEWVRAGDAFTLLPSNHATGTSADTAVTVLEDGMLTDVNIGSQAKRTTHERLMDYIPRVFLSKDKGPLDAIEPYDPDADPQGIATNSLLNQFLYGFSLTADEMLTYAEFINPESSGKNTDPSILTLQSHQFNLPFDTAGVSRSQKRMVREAMYTYRRKGTKLGLQSAVEAITGYDTVISESRNLMLSPQDSTFYKGLGFWSANAGCTLTAEGYTQATPTLMDEPQAIDIDWVGKVDVTTGNSKISTGLVSPLTRAIPVAASTAYTLSLYANFSGDPGTSEAQVTGTIYWYNRLGGLISTSEVLVSADAFGGWLRTEGDAISPSTAVYAGIELKFNVVGDWFIDMIQFEQGTTATNFQEARGVYVTLNAPKVNYILDPSFEGDLSTWSIFGATNSAEDITVGGVYDGPMNARAGLKKLVAVGNSSKTTVSTQVTDIASGNFYTFSFFAKASAAVNADIQIGSDVKTVSLTTDWKRYYFTTFLKTVNPVGTTVSVSGNWNGKTIELDCMQFESSYYPTDYFDGAMILAGAAWEGAPNESVSHFYPARDNKITRLTNQIERYLPLNTPYHFTMVRGVGSMVPPKGFA